MHSIARCCQPIPGDEIVGYITQGRGFRFTVQIVSNCLNYKVSTQNELWRRIGAKAIPLV